MKYPSIRIEGSILSPDLIDRLEDLPGQKPADFGLDSGTKVKDEIARAWADAQDYWRIFRRKLDALRPDASATTETRNLWIVPLLGLLRHELEYQKSGAELNGKTYAISHRVANRGHTPVHILGYRDPAGLDRKPANATLRMSAHAVVQEFLNLNEQLYGLVTNGRVLRLLRDSSRLIKQSYLEFDLERIFTDGLFADFAVLYRLFHASRLPASPESAAESLIERYHQDSLDSGARIRDGLSRAVESALLTFGHGFLAHPANRDLRERVADGRLDPTDYYKSLLRLIYRLLFLMVIEERGLVFPSAATQRQRETYARCYSVHRLRAFSEKRYLADKRQSDLWLALLSTFRLFEAAGPGAKLGLKPLAGDLFRGDAIGELAGCQLPNDAILSCLRDMGLYQHPQTRQLIRVNYAALNVEEFGSVYEGLLEYEPVFDRTGPLPAFAFQRGDERAATGSHYTPDDLVQPLIKHSLDHLIAGRLTAKDPEAALLDLRVADISCGSGHILLAAARRIATALATVRTGEEQPSPSAFRAALRDVIRHCIYGVDLNPLAVELCKVALWLEAHVPGEPLNFLDHHIKCGNSIVGFVRREELEGGVPDEAFVTLPGDDKEVAASFRRKNRDERLERAGAVQETLNLAPELQQQLDAILARWREISHLPERNPAEIETKKSRYEAFTRSQDAWLLNQIAAIPIAQFYLPKTAANKAELITNEEFRTFLAGHRHPQGQATAAAWALSERKRFFHWFLQFPEIIARGGFDCILGNPPYLGGTHLSGTFGHSFCEYVKWEFAPTGLSDLVVFFLRRIFTILRPNGFASFITTNSIKDGDIRTDGLEQVIAAGGSINMAVRGIKWPGVANLVVSLVSIYRGKWSLPRHLDGKPVELINAFFEDQDDEMEPNNLIQNKAQIFEGYKFLGDGFLLSHEEAAALIATDFRNSEVIQPVINGDELNNHPVQAPGRKIINFLDWPLDKAKSYPDLIARVYTLVRPVREKDNRQLYRDNWWIFGENRPGLRRNLAPLKGCFVVARTTKHLSFSRAPTNTAFTDALKVFTTDRWDLYAVVQSTIHEVWARKYSGALKQDLRYSPSKCFDTFAFPAGQWQTANPQLAEIGERYHEHRRRLMLQLWLGLTDVYNLFHSPELEAGLAKHFATRARKDPQGLSIPAEHRSAALAYTPEQALAGLKELRRLHVALDHAVLESYRWTGQVDLGHAFHDVETLPENDRTRYTISPAARKELLSRLLQLNHQRAAEEQAAAPTKKSAKKPRVPKARAAAGDELDLGLDLFGNVTPKPVVSVRVWTDDVFRLPVTPRHAALAEDLYVRHWVHALLTLQPEGQTGSDLFNAFRLLLTKDSRKVIAASGDGEGKKWSRSFDQPVSLLGFFGSLLNLAKNREIECAKVDGKTVFRRTAGWSASPSDWVRVDAELSQRALIDKSLNDQLLPFVEPSPQVTAFIQALENAIA